MFPDICTLLIRTPSVADVLRQLEQAAVCTQTSCFADVDDLVPNAAPPDATSATAGYMPVLLAFVLLLAYAAPPLRAAVGDKTPAPSARRGADGDDGSAVN